MTSLKPDEFSALKTACDAAILAAKRGEDLQSVLADLMRAVEAHSGDGILASVLLLDASGERLINGAAPSLPPDYTAAIDGLAIGPAAGSCGTAAYYGEPVFVSDIRQDPIWAEFAPLADRHGLRACWSAPIRDAEGRVVGTFANYHLQPRLPKAREAAAISYLADVVAEVIAAAKSE